MSDERWMHLRHPDGFDDQRFALFAAHCAIFQAYAQALLANWTVLFPARGPAPSYRFGEPARSEDRRVVTLPIAGPWTLGSRSYIENLSSWMLWSQFPLDFLKDLEEGLTETIDESGPQTSWRTLAPRLIGGECLLALVPLR
jgi:hypothetical protein